MNGVRLNETVVNTTRALQESSSIYVNINHRCHSFDVPISQLLRIERDRGLDHERSHDFWWTTKRFKYGSHHERSLLVVSRRTLSRKPETTQIAPTFNVPHCRSFSVQAEKKYALPPQRPLPPLPPKASKPHLRVPSSEAAPRNLLARTPSAVSNGQHVKPSPPPQLKTVKPTFRAPAPETRPLDALTKVSSAFLTGDQQTEEAEKRLREIQKFHLEMERIANLLQLDLHKLLVFLRIRKPSQNPKDAHVSQLSRSALRHCLAQARLSAQEYIKNAYARNRTRVEKLEERVRESRDLLLTHATVNKAIRQTVLTARRDFRWDRHYIVSGLDALEKRVSQTADFPEAFRCDLAELKFTIDWNAWNKDRTFYRLQDAIKISNELKSPDGMHRQTNTAFESLRVLSTSIAKILSEIENDLKTNKLNVSPQQKSHYQQMLSALDSTDDLVSISAQAHIWRKANLYALISSRFPQAVSHSLLELDARVVLFAARDNSRKIATLLRSGLGNTFPPRKRAIFQEILKRHSQCSQLHTQFFIEYTTFLHKGMLIHNPSLSSDFGRLKYAVFRPFSEYITTSDEVQSFMRYTAELFKNLNALSKASDRGRVRRQIASETLDTLYPQSRESSRSLLQSINELSLRITGRLLNYDDLHLRNLFAQTALKAKVDVERSHAFDRLSRPEWYRSYDENIGLIDPIVVRGKNKLYPSKIEYPVEYVTSDERFLQVLRELSQAKVIGLDVVQGVSTPAYICIASTDKVALFEGKQLEHFFGPRESILKEYFIQLLEDRNLVKVVHNIQALKHMLKSSNIIPKGIISLDSQKLATAVRPLGRATTRGSWIPLQTDDDRIKSLPYFLTELAFLPVYNLLTFLNSVTPERLSGLHPDVQSSILRARKLLRERAGENEKSGLELGPVVWDHIGSSSMLRGGLSRSLQGHKGSLLAIVEKAATSELIRLHGRMTERRSKDRDVLAAYYLYTTFAEDLPTIAAVLRGRNLATDILQLATRMKLPLHLEDRERLRVAAEASSAIAETPYGRIADRDEVEAKETLCLTEDMRLTDPLHPGLSEPTVKRATTRERPGSAADMAIEAQRTHKLEALKTSKLRKRMASNKLTPGHKATAEDVSAVPMTPEGVTRSRDQSHGNTTWYEPRSKEMPTERKGLFAGISDMFRQALSGSSKSDVKEESNTQVDPGQGTGKSIEGTGKEARLRLPNLRFQSDGERLETPRKKRRETAKISRRPVALKTLRPSHQDIIKSRRSRG